MKNPPPCLSELPFAVLLVYAPWGQSSESARSRRVRDAIKRDSAWRGQDQSLIRYAIEKLRAEIDDGALGGFFGPDVGLVPAPRSAPLTKDSLWPALRISQELVRVGLGGQILNLLQRLTPVRKAAFAARMGLPRPTVTEHLASLACSPALLAPTRLLVIDDVVTSGSMLIAAASHVKAACPDRSVRGFALLRTMSGVEVARILAPCTGLITYEDGDYARRVP